MLVRFNPDGDATMNARQLERLRRLADWLHAQPDASRVVQLSEAGRREPDDSRAADSSEAGGRARGEREDRRERKFLFELLVPATDDQLRSVDGDGDRYDAELRPELMRRAIEAIQNGGVEVDVWKIEGVGEREDTAMLAEQTRRGGDRQGVVCVLLGRGASTEQVEHWLHAAPVEGFIGFAIGRSIWWHALKGFLSGELERGDAVAQVADNYLHCMEIYEQQAVH